MSDQHWPIGTRLDCGPYGRGTVIEHRSTGPVVLFDEPYEFGRGNWRHVLRWEDVRVIGDGN